MKKNYLYIAAAVAVLYLLKQKKTAQSSDYATEIKYGTPNGWRYFSDGTAIAPNGDYYKGGILIYSAS